MEWVETTGRTVEEAKDAALDRLGVDHTDAEFVIVSEPKAGLFGRMRGEARVRARVRPTSPRPKRSRSRRPGQEQRRDSGRRAGEKGHTGAVATSVAESVDVRPGGRVKEPMPSSNGSTGEASAHRKRRRSSRGTSGRTGAGGAVGQTGSGGVGPRKEREPNGAGRASRPAVTKEETVEEVLTLQEQAESAREFIEGLVNELGLRATVSVRVVDADTAEVAVDGQGLGILVGPGGATLGALQELARTVVQRRTGGHSERILVDVAGYRAKRAEALQRFARQVADDVVTSGSERALEPMLAADRKIVHDTVASIDGVTTRSEGEEPRRFIVISPMSTPDSSDDVED